MGGSIIKRKNKHQVLVDVRDILIEASPERQNTSWSLAQQGQSFWDEYSRSSHVCSGETGKPQRALAGATPDERN